MTEGTHAREVDESGDPPEVPVPPVLATWRSLLRTARPKQWTNKLIVLASCWD